MSTIVVEHYILVSMLLFSIGTLGVLLRRNALVILMSLELMLSASILALIAFSRFNATPDNPMFGGLAFALFIIAIAACEVAIGLAIITTLWRRYQTVDLDRIRELKH